jgi:hypothetical protein
VAGNCFGTGFGPLIILELRRSESKRSLLKQFMVDLNSFKKPVLVLFGRIETLRREASDF